MKLLAVALLFPLACSAADVLTGTVGAPGGKLALERSLFIAAAHAHVPGLEAVAGATVDLLEGSKVLASGTTNDRGVYSFPAPAGFAPSPRYIVQATSGGHRLQAFVTALRTNIDPATDATARLILEHANVARLRTVDVQEVLPLVQHLAWEVNLPAARSGSELGAMLRTAAANDEELFHIIASLGAAREIQGQVTDAAKQPLARITILARDAAGVARAIAHTDAQGRYRVRVPPGDYTVDAINETAASRAASQLGARTHSFQLRAGGRVSGTVRGTDGSRLTGIRVKLGAVEVRTQDDGSYRMSVAPGSYLLTAQNTTLQPFASNLGGARLDIKRGDEYTVDVKLSPGQLVSGAVKPGSTVRIEDAESREPVAVLRANRAGEYRVWLWPGRYVVQ